MCFLTNSNVKYVIACISCIISKSDNLRVCVLYLSLREGVGIIIVHGVANIIRGEVSRWVETEDKTERERERVCVERVSLRKVRPKKL